MENSELDKSERFWIIFIILFCIGLFISGVYSDYTNKKTSDKFIDGKIIITVGDNEYIYYGGELVPYKINNNKK